MLGGNVGCCYHYLLHYHTVALSDLYYDYGSGSKSVAHKTHKDANPATEIFHQARETAR